MRGDDNTPTIWSEQDYARYSFTAGNKRLYTGDFVQSNKHFYEVGEEVEVFYSIDDSGINCTERQIDEDRKTNKFFIFMFTVIIVMVIGMLMMFLFD